MNIIDKPIVKTLMLKGEKGDPGDLDSTAIVDNLTTNRADKVLSAKQGKVLKDLVDANKIVSDHGIINLNSALALKANTADVASEYATKESVNDNISSLDAKVNSLASGSPLVASSISDMTDTTRIYVNTTDGNWYYYDGSNWVVGGVYTSVTGYDEAITDLTINASNFKYPSISLFKDLTKIVAKSFPIHGASVTDLTIENYEERTIDNNIIQYCTLPIRIKYDTGSPIFTEWNFNPSPYQSSSADFILYFDKDGKYLSPMKYNNANSHVIPSNAYFAAFQQYKTSTGVSEYDIKNNQTIEVEWLNADLREALNEILSEVELEYIVDINGSGDYTSLTECFNAIRNNPEKKIIRIKPGTYNIFEEIGGSTFALNIDDTTTWRNVSTFVPNNTKIIGEGNVILNFLPELDEISATGSSYLSCLNVQGNFEMENVKLFAKNCRYVIHDETSDLVEYQDTSRKYKNVELHYISGRSTGIGGTAYGCGFMKGMTYEFNNVLLESTAKAFPISFHNGTTDGGANITFNNCIFKSANANRQCLELVANSKSNQEIKINLSNCYMNYKGINIIPNNQWLVIPNPYQIYVNNSNSICGNITVNTTDNFTNTRTPEIYNVIN